MRAFALLFIATLFSCTSPVLHRQAARVEAPADFPMQSESQPVTDSWWHDFQSDELNQLVAESLANSPTLAIAVARVQQAQALAVMAGASRKPQVNGSFSGSRRKQNFIGLPIPGSEGGVLSTTTSTWNTSLQVSWELDLWGRLRDQQYAAMHDYEATEYDFQAVRLSLIGQVVKTYFTLLESQRQLSLAESTVASYRRDHEQIANRYRLGLRSSLDLRLSQANLALAQAAWEARQIQRNQIARTLQVLLGHYPNGLITTTQQMPPTSKPLPHVLPAQLVSRRPDLAAADRRLESGSLRLDAANKARFPQFSLAAATGTTSQDLDHAFDPDFGVWNLLANLMQPFYQGGRIKASMYLAAAQLDQADAQFRDLLIRAFEEIEASLDRQRGTAARIKYLTAAAQQSVAAQELAEDRYRKGLANYGVVLEAQRRALQSQSDLIAARRELIHHRVDLYLAFGGGFEAAPILERTLHD